MIMLLKLKRFLSYAVFEALLLIPGVVVCEGFFVSRLYFYYSSRLWKYSKVPRVHDMVAANSLTANTASNF